MPFTSNKNFARSRSWARLVLLSTVALIGASAAAAQTSKGSCPQTQVFGSMKLMASGDLSRQVAFSDLDWSPNAIALGATEGKTMEVTAADGVLWLVGPGDDGAPVVHEAPTTEGGALLVYAAPEAWSMPVPIEATTPEQVLDEVARVASESACAGQEVVPFRVRGHAAELTWSTVGQPEGLLVTDQDVDVIIVGFRAPSKQGEFVPPGIDGHLHVVLPTKNRAGHLRAIQLDPGATVELPR